MYQREQRINAHFCNENFSEIVSEKSEIVYKTFGIQQYSDETLTVKRVSE